MEQRFLSDEYSRIAQHLKKIEKSCCSNKKGGLKNASRSETLRKSANELRSRGGHQKLDTMRVLKLYSESIATAPPSSDELKLAYYARSDFSFQLNLIPESIEDLDRILTLGCAENLKLKILFRKAECLFKNYNELEESDIDDIVEKIADLALDNGLKNSFTEKIRQHKSSLYKRIPNYNEELKDALKYINDCAEKEKRKKFIRIDFQDTIPCASKAISIEYDKYYGRKVIANDEIRPGQVLAVEKMHSFALEPSAFYSHCSHCAKVAWTSVPCDHCSYSVYCSDKCKEEGWNMYHEIECKIVSKLLDTYEDHDKYRMVLALRIVIKAVNENGGDISRLRDDLKAIDTASDQCRRGFAKNGEWNNNWRSVLSLVSNADKRSKKDLVKVSKLSAEALHHLTKMTKLFERSMKGSSYERDVLFIGALISRMYHMILYNNFSMMETQHSSSRHAYLFSSYGRSTNYTDLGIFISPFCSLVNHSCFPNAATCLTDDGQMVLYSLSSIKKGTQVCICYKYFCCFNEKYPRQYYLRTISIDDCHCTPCEEDWPLLDEAQMVRTKTNLKPFLLCMLSQIYDDHKNPRRNEQLMKVMIEDALEEIVNESMFPTKEFYELTEMLMHLVVILYGRWFQIPEISP
ncbi:hypothetical protein QAD02_018851 [Eretmocerus hayati]|uniref:Uncharacterized protein n=1 Tax=Eretmocerus hayati TaxID=131215 RepID=A0ACC2PKG0_9HYME|nr:hypothetical protein QAD02_018851 [Eretmocerus hayati]